MPSKSEKQRRYFGYLYSLKKAGKKSDKWKSASKSAKKTVNDMSIEELKDFLRKDENHIMCFNDFCKLNEKKDTN